MERTSNGIRYLKQTEFEREVLKAETPTVVDFFADWCGPCRMVGPIMDSLSAEYAGRVNFAKIDTDQNQGLAVRYDIMSIPTVMIFKDGKVVDKIVGAVPPQVYRRRIDDILSAN
jgi:thioredoxin 1